MLLIRDLTPPDFIPSFSFKKQQSFLYSHASTLNLELFLIYKWPPKKTVNTINNKLLGYFKTVI